MNDQKYIIKILPYISLEEEFKIGNIVFYSFEKSGKKYIQDEWLYENVKKVIHCFARFHYQSFEYARWCDGTIIGYLDDDSVKLNPYDIVEILSYAELNSEFDKPNSWDIKDIEIIKKQNETIFQIENYCFNESRIPEMVFYPPNFLEMKRFNPEYLLPRNKIGSSESSDMLWGLIQCLKKSKSTKNKEEKKANSRIISAIKFRNQSEREEYKYKENIRIVLISAAFEALFNLSNKGIAQSFSNSISLLLGDCFDELKHWSKDFYNVRSRIVHGDEDQELTYKSYFGGIEHVKHYKIAKTIFDICLRTKLYLMGVHNQYQYYRPYSIPEIKRIIIPNKVKIDNILKLNPSEICDDLKKTKEYVENIDSIRYWDKSTDHTGCVELINFIKEIILEIIDRLLNIDEINKGFKQPLEAIKTLLNKKPADKNLYYELMLLMREHNASSEKNIWSVKINQQCLSIENLVGDLSKLSEFMRD